jgi:hypothetical protein
MDGRWQYCCAVYVCKEVPLSTEDGHSPLQPRCDKYVLRVFSLKLPKTRKTTQYPYMIDHIYLSPLHPNPSLTPNAQFTTHTRNIPPVSVLQPTPSGIAALQKAAHLCIPPQSPTTTPLQQGK